MVSVGNFNFKIFQGPLAGFIERLNFLYFSRSAVEKLWMFFKTFRHNSELSLYLSETQH